MTDERISRLPVWLWVFLGVLAIALVLSAVGLVFLCARRRRRGLLGLSLALLPFCYVLLQSILLLNPVRTDHGALGLALAALLLSVPPPALIAGMLLLALGMVLFYRKLLQNDRAGVTAMSVKEAVDSLPVGVCCYLPGGQIVLANAVMETLCQSATGRPLISGAMLYEALNSGSLLPGCSRVEAGEQTILLLADGSARAVTVQTAGWENQELTVLLAADVTEVYEKTLALEEKQKELSALNRRLAAYNREIVDLTINSEVLAARVRLHDAMGEDLLTMKQVLLQGADASLLEALRRRLQRNVSFLREDSSTEAADEFAVLLRTAESLGVCVELRGKLPQNDPQRRVVATGLHECLTNLLRHARGNLLRMTIRDEADQLVAAFSGNGEAPAGPIRETGGLRTLRILTEEAGGTMTVTAAPDVCVTLTLPREVPHGL